MACFFPLFGVMKTDFCFENIRSTWKCVRTCLENTWPIYFFLKQAQFEIGKIWKNFQKLKRENLTPVLFFRGKKKVYQQFGGPAGGGRYFKFPCHLKWWKMGRTARKIKQIVILGLFNARYPRKMNSATVEIQDESVIIPIFHLIFVNIFSLFG